MRHSTHFLVLLVIVAVLAVSCSLMNLVAAQHDHHHDHVHFDWASFNWLSPPLNAMVHEYKCDVELKNVALSYTVTYGEHFLATEPDDDHITWNAGRAHGPDTFEVVDFHRGKLRYYTHLHDSHDHDHDGTEDHHATPDHPAEHATPRCTLYNVSWMELSSIEFAPTVAIFEAVGQFIPLLAWQAAGRSIDATRNHVPVYHWIVPLVHLFDNSTVCVPGFSCVYDSLLNVTNYDDGETDHLGHVSLPDSAEMFWGLIDGNLSSSIVSRVESEVLARQRSLSSTAQHPRVQYRSSFRFSLSVSLSNESSIWDEETLEANSIMALPVRMELVGELYAKQPGSASYTFVRNVHSILDWYQVQPLNLRMHHDIYNHELLPCYAPGEEVYEDDHGAGHHNESVSYRTTNEIRPTYPSVVRSLNAHPSSSSPFPSAVFSPAFQSEVLITSSEPSAVSVASFFWYTDGRFINDTQHLWTASPNAWREAVEFYNGTQVLQLFIYNSTSPTSNGVVYSLIASTLTTRVETAIDSCSFAPLVSNPAQRAYAPHPALDLHDGSVHFLLTGGRFNGSDPVYNSYLSKFVYSGRSTVRGVPVEAWSANFSRSNPSRADGSIFTYRQTIFVAPSGYLFPGRDELRREIISERTHGVLNDAPVLLAIETTGVRTRAGVNTSYSNVFDFVNYWPNNVPTDTLNPDRSNYPCPMSPYSDQVIRMYNLTASAATATTKLFTPRSFFGAAYLANNASVETSVGVLESPPRNLVVFGGIDKSGASLHNDVFVSSDAGFSFVPASSVTGLTVSEGSIYCAAQDGSLFVAFNPPSAGVGTMSWSFDGSNWSTRTLSAGSVVLDAACAVDRNRNIYLVGGRRGFGQSSSAALVSNNFGATWVSKASLPSPRYSHSLAYAVVGNTEYFVVAGGVSSGSATTIFMSTNRMQSWQAVTPSSPFVPRSRASLLITTGGVWVYTAGRAFVDSNAVLISYTNGSTWRLCSFYGSMFAPRWGQAGLLDANGYLTVLGGSQGASSSRLTFGDAWRSSFSFDDRTAVNLKCV